MLHAPISSPIRTIDQAKHDAIAADVAAFVKSGRKITQIPIGIGSETPPATMRQMDEHRYNGRIEKK